jgi:hypothetical protein
LAVLKALKFKIKGIDGRIILRWIFMKGDWMELAQDRDRWRAFVGTVRDFRVP